MLHATTLARPDQVNLDRDALAAATFLARYGEPTRTGYTLALRQWFTWCADNGITPLTATRGYIEVWATTMLERQGLKASTVAGKLNAVRGFYRFAKIDGLIADDPAEYIARPKVPRQSTRQALTRTEVLRCVETARMASSLDHALWCLLCFNGLRISEACGIDVEHLGRAGGFRTVHVTRRKGNLSGPITLAARTAWAIDTMVGSRRHGPLFRKPRKNERLDQKAANRIVHRITKAAGVEKTITPHSLRHTCITLALDAGVHPRDIRNTLGYSDDRMVAYYDRGRHNPARDATLMVSAWVEGS